jgi:signal transduction histidine kinase
VIPVIVVVDPGYVGHEAIRDLLGTGYAVTTAIGLSELISAAAGLEMPIVLVPQSLAPEPGYALLDALAAHRIEAVGLLIVDDFQGVPRPSSHSGVHAFVPRPFTPEALACHIAAAARTRAVRLAEGGVARVLERDMATLKSGLRHELRGHLQGVVGLSTLLLDIEESRRAPDDESLDWLRRITAAGHRLTRLIDHLSDWIVVATRPLEIAVVDLVALADEAAAEARSQWIKRRPNVTVVATPEAANAARVPADARALAATFRQILDNAIRWNPRETPTCEISIEAARDPRGPAAGTEAAAHGWLVRFRDEGPGVPEAVRERVFGMFDKHVHDPDAPPGTGMGLALVKKIADRHGAHAWLEGLPDPAASGLTACLFWPGAA